MSGGTVAPVAQHANFVAAATKNIANSFKASNLSGGAFGARELSHWFLFRLFSRQSSFGSGLFGLPLLSFGCLIGFLSLGSGFEADCWLKPVVAICIGHLLGANRLYYQLRKRFNRGFVSY